jgi:THO complex subunit 1
LEGFYDKTFVNDDLETTYKNLEKYIFGDDDKDEPPRSTPTEEPKESLEVTNTEVEMADGDAPAAEVAEAAPNEVVSARSELLEATMKTEEETAAPAEDHLPAAETKAVESDSTK